nr:restriction endonuclease subunit S [uncultured Pseudoxanthomonas sp.]
MAEQSGATATPRLRFPEFRGTSAWPISLLGTAATFEKGRGISKAEIDPDGALYCIRYGELYTRYGEVIREAFSKTNADESTLFFSRSNDVIVPASGETKDDIATASCVLLDGIALGSDLNVIRSPHDGVFLSYLLNGSKKRQLAKVAQGDTVVHLYPRQLAALSVALPEACEQKKIADCLTSLDEVIAAQVRKLEALKAYKRGLMQQLFPRDGETRPRLRFPEFRNAPEWELKALNRVCDMQAGKFVSASEISDQQADGRFPCYGGNGLRGYTNSFTHSGAFPLIGRQGALCGNVQFAEGDFYATEHALVVSPKRGVVVPWLYYALGKLALNRFATGQAQPGLSVDVLKAVECSVPATELEQQRIADCLSSLDTQITAESNRLAALKTHKRGLMQQLFPAPDAATA